MFMSSTDGLKFFVACTSLVSPKHKEAFGRHECM
jgi:hypothetical protein